MAKKTASKKNTPKETPTSSDNIDKFNVKICEFKHEVIEKEFKNIKTDAEKRHEEIKNILQESQNNLKDKIILTEKILGEKIDKLSDFDDTLKGNGKPGVWESIRLLNKSVKIIIGILVLIVILNLGGNFRGLTWEKIKDKIGMSNTETKQVDSQKEVIKTVEKDTLEENIGS